MADINPDNYSVGLVLDHLITILSESINPTNSSPNPLGLTDFSLDSPIIIVSGENARLSCQTSALFVELDPQSSSNCCPICYQTLPQRVNLRMHLVATHWTQVTWTNGIQDDFGDSTIVPSQRIVNLAIAFFRCPKCDDSFENRLKLEAHYIHHHFVGNSESANHQMQLLPSANSSVGSEPITCSQCGDSMEPFSSSYELAEHHRFHHAKSLPCPHCTLRFWYSTSLGWHMKHAHQQQLPQYPRTKDARSFVPQLHGVAPNDSAGHASKSEDGKHACTECKETFTKTERLRNHFSRKHPSTRWCEFCRLCLESEKQLFEHYQQAHESGKVNLKEIVGKIYDCSYCHLRWRAKKSLRRHIQSRHFQLPYRCELCHKNFRDSEYLRRHERLHSGRFRCGNCDDTLDSFYDMRSHLRQQHPPVQYNCCLCAEVFSHQVAYSKHLTRAHNRQKVWFCEQCPGRGYSQRRGYQEHMLTHADVKNFSCRDCDKQFYSRAALKEHTRWHTKPYLCEDCGQSFSTNETLGRHIIHKHSDDNAKSELKVICEICGKHVFKNNLPVHMVYHKDREFSCPVCGKLFFTFHNLKTHQLCHSDVRPYACQCGESFKLPHHLRNHQRRHTGQPNPYERKRIKIG